MSFVICIVFSKWISFLNMYLEFELPLGLSVGYIKAKENLNLTVLCIWILTILKGFSMTFKLVVVIFILLAGVCGMCPMPQSERTNKTTLKFLTMVKTVSNETFRNCDKGLQH